MEQRFNAASLSADGYKALIAIERYLGSCGIEAKLLHLIKLRASQLNGCAFCLDMHWKDLRAIGESEQRLYGLDAWQEASYYTQRERAALKWTEAVTLVTHGHVPDDVYNSVREQFSEKELSDLTLAISTINAWNRLAIASRTAAGNYKPPTHSAQHG